jgi:hypothetical protein
MAACVIDDVTSFVTILFVQNSDQERQYRSLKVRWHYARGVMCSTTIDRMPKHTDASVVSTPT